jgi:hypothetical protein
LRTAAGDRWKLDLIYLSHPFQIEKATVKGDTLIPMHRHPNVDSYEVYSGGGGVLRIGKRVFKISESIMRIPLSIPRDAWHGGEVAPCGSTFFSIQFWHQPGTGPITTDWESEIDWKNSEKIALPLDAI